MFAATNLAGAANFPKESFQVRQANDEQKPKKVQSTVGSLSLSVEFSSLKFKLEQSLKSTAQSERGPCSLISRGGLKNCN